jgi:hypothetical protein
MIRDVQKYIFQLNTQLKELLTAELVIRVARQIKLFVFVPLRTIKLKNVRR